jgi:hypothetical protein
MNITLLIVWEGFQPQGNFNPVYSTWEGYEPPWGENQWAIPNENPLHSSKPKRPYSYVQARITKTQ